MSNHQWAQALRLDDPAYRYYDDTTYFTSVDVFADASFASPVVDPPEDAAYWFREAFYKYTPAADQRLTIQCADTGGADTAIFFYARTGNAWQSVPVTQPYLSLLTADVTGGTTYYVMFAYGSDTPTGDGQLVFSAQVAPPSSSKWVDAPPAVVSVVGFTRVPGTPDEVVLPPVVTTVRIGTPDEPAGTDPGTGGGGADIVQVPAIGVHVGVGVPSTFAGLFVLSSPEDGTVVATATPDFVVGVISEDDDAQYTVQIQYADNPAMSNPVLLTDDVEAVDGGAIVAPANPVPATTYWRARLLEGSTVRVDWSAVQSFTVNTATSSASLPITWTVSASAARPIHVWHIDPAGPDIGDTVTVYGQGFPTNGHLSFGDHLLDVASWTYVAATADNTTDAGRVIDADTVTCEHYEVTFVAPTYDGPGAALTVED